MSDVNKAALNYLTQSGATPISIVETAEGVCEFVLKADPAALVTFWTHQRRFGASQGREADRRQELPGRRHGNGSSATGCCSMPG
jgi:hypothetical protein